MGSFQDRYQSIDINKRYTSLNAGITASYYGYSFEYRHDIQGRSQGSTLKIGYTKLLPVNSSLIVMAMFGLEWFDDYYANYYFSGDFSSITQKNFFRKSFFLGLYLFFNA